MKITRKQLRKLINEIRIKPGGDMEPEHSEKLTRMIDSGDEAFITQADELAPMVGYEGESFSQDMQIYKYESIIGHVGEFISYLKDEHLKMLMNVRDKELRYALYSWAGFGFAFTDGGSAISPDDFYEMQYRIAAKKRDIDDDDIAEHEGVDTGVEAAHKLAQAIMSLSKQTLVSIHTIGDAGIGEEQRSLLGFIFYEPKYEQLYDAGKLVITR